MKDNLCVDCENRLGRLSNTGKCLKCRHYFTGRQMTLDDIPKGKVLHLRDFFDDWTMMALATHYVTINDPSFMR